MTIATIDLRELPNRVAEVVALVNGGREMIVTVGHVPLARLVPLDSSHPRIPGLHAGAIGTSDDFDSPLPDSFWTGTT